jgi:hypothetical protein
VFCREDDSSSVSCTGSEPCEPPNCEHSQGSSLIINTKCPASVCKEVETESDVLLHGRKHTCFIDHRQAINNVADSHYDHRTFESPFVWSRGDRCLDAPAL